LQSGRRLPPDLVGRLRANGVQPEVAVRPGVFADAIQAATDELVVDVACSPGQVLEAQRLRYGISCGQRGVEASNDGLERDEFDPASRHVLLRSRLTGAVLGAVRLILSDTGLDGLPMRRACAREVFAPLPARSTGEISRFAVARQRPGISPGAAALVRLCLIRGIVQVSAQQQLTHWCALMERVLLRLLQATAIHFEAVGPVVEYHGPRQPAVCAITSMLQRMKREQAALWGYLTDNGALWSAASATQRTPS